MSEKNLNKSKDHKKKVFITTPIYYPNNKFHVGTAFTTVLVDVLKGIFQVFDYEVISSTGLDEHGQKVQKAMVNKPDYLDNLYKEFEYLLSKLQTNYDIVVRTTNPHHKERVIKCWNQCLESGLLYKGVYVGYYSLRDETFFKESELINGKAPTGADVEKQNVECYFFKMSIFQQRLEDFIKNNNMIIIPEHKQYLLSFFQDGLKDLCVTREGNIWGIPVPNETNATIYVWFDALLNYLIDDWSDYDVIHVMAKDIAIFHGVHWPTILMALNKPMFNKMLVHNWWLVDNEKMSKSLNNSVDPLAILEKYSADVFRFFCAKECLLHSDGNFNIDHMVQAFNSLVVNKFSNLIHRVYMLLVKNHMSTKYEIHNHYVEIELLKEVIIDLNIGNYVQILLKWCDKINGQIDQEVLWKNPHKAYEYYVEILTLGKYFTPIFPHIDAKLKNYHTPLFQRV